MSTISKFLQAHLAEVQRRDLAASTGRPSTTSVAAEVLEALSTTAAPLTTENLVAIGDVARRRLEQLQVVQNYLQSEVKGQESDSLSTVVRLVAQDTGLSEAFVLEKFGVFYDGLLKDQVEAGKVQIVERIKGSLAESGITDLKGASVKIVTALVETVVREQGLLNNKAIQAKYEDVGNPQSDSYRNLIVEIVELLKASTKKAKEGE